MREIRKIALDGNLIVTRPGTDIAMIGDVLMIAGRGHFLAGQSRENSKTEAAHLHRFLGDHFSLATLLEFTRILKPMLDKENWDGKAISDGRTD